MEKLFPTGNQMIYPLFYAKKPGFGACALPSLMICEATFKNEASENF